MLTLTRVAILIKENNSRLQDRVTLQKLAFYPKKDTFLAVKDERMPNDISAMPSSVTTSPTKWGKEQQHYLLAETSKMRPSCSLLGPTHIFGTFWDIAHVSKRTLQQMNTPSHDPNRQ